MQSIALIAVLALGQTSGVKITEIVAGKGAAVKSGDTVTVVFTGKLDSGKVFDTTEGKAPFAFRLGTAQVFPGWEKGVLGMKVGGRRKVVVPPELGYGSKNMGVIPPNSRLTLDFKLLRIEPSGVKQKVEIKEIKIGTGRAAKAGDSVAAHYKGTFLNGIKFDSSYDRGRPIEWSIGRDMIKGFDEGVKGMKLGGKRRVVVPYELAYGRAGRQGIPPMSTLVFELELVRLGP